MNPDTDRWVRSAEAQAKFRDLLDGVEDGAHIYVLRYDKPAAVLVPVDWYEGIKAAVPEGYYRDGDGTLKRQHDVYGGPHDELAGE